MADPIAIHISDIVMMPVSELKPHPKNPNSHSKEQIKRLAEILSYQGWRYPIKVSKLSGYITSGHGRLEAARFLGLDEVPVSFQDYADTDQEYADIVADNAIASWSELDFSAINREIENFSPDFNIDLLGIDGFKIDVAEKGLTDADSVPENVDTRAKRGDVWILGNHRLMCGDSTSMTDVEKLMAGEKADMVWTDPPYNVNYEGGTGMKIMNDKMSDSDFRRFLTDAFSSMAAFTKPGGSIYVAHADFEGYNFRGACRDSGWLIKQCLIWKKSSLVMGRQDYQWIHEPILYGWLDGGSHNWFGDRKQTTVLEFDKPSRNAEHPTMKPVELVEYCIENSSRPNNIVVDLFGGSGTTLVSCEKVGRVCRTMELDPRYCDVIIKRWEDYTGQQATLSDETEHIEDSVEHV